MNLSRSKVIEYLATDKANKAALASLAQRSSDQIAKSLAHFIFRNGPIEDMHARPNSKLTDADMKILNKFTHNRLAYIVEVVRNKRWSELALVVEQNAIYGSDWDPAEPDDGGTIDIFLMDCKNYRKQRKNSLAH